MKLGDILEYIINIITFGKGKDIAQWIAHKLGFEDCGCDDRKNWLNGIARTRTKTKQRRVSKVDKIQRN
tara:strand:+ start:896 stop:1102 length:207 start_codon:yes stop_codon:yes gene_type:complete